MVFYTVCPADNRYLKFVRLWKKHCLRAMDEYTRFGNTRLWEQQQEVHKPRLEDWSCGCTCWRCSPYHICKHLIRLYISEEGIRSNKPPMPFYGQVWRQSTPPLLWVAGKHDPVLLKVYDLQRRPENLAAETLAPPIRALPIVDNNSPADGTFLNDLNQAFNTALRLEPALCYTDDEYESDDNGVEDGVEDEDEGGESDII